MKNMELYFYMNSEADATCTAADASGTVREGFPGPLRVTLSKASWVRSNSPGPRGARFVGCSFTAKTQRKEVQACECGSHLRAGPGAAGRASFQCFISWSRRPECVPLGITLSVILAEVRAEASRTSTLLILRVESQNRKSRDRPRVILHLPRGAAPTQPHPATVFPSADLLWGTKECPRPCQWAGGARMA